MKNLLDVMQMLVILVVVMVLWVYTSVKTHQVVLFGYVWFNLHLLYLNKTVNTKEPLEKKTPRPVVCVPRIPPQALVHGHLSEGTIRPPSTLVWAVISPALCSSHQCPCPVFLP